jgi:protease II
MTLPIAPRAATRPHAFTHHGITIEDPWAWLKDPAYPNVDDEDVLAYLREENAYFDAAMAPHETLVDTIFEEMKGRLKQDDSSVPQKEGDYLYWWAYETGGQYPRWWRRPIGGGADELILDEPKEAEGKEYFRLGALTVSPDGKLLAWAADESGAERFTLRIRDLATGADIETVSTVINGGVAWSAGSDAILYTEVNDNWRSYRALLHTLGDDPAKDAQLYEEADEGFRVAVGNTHDRAWLMIATGDNQTSEVRIIPATDPTAEPLLVSPRQVKRQYSVESAHGSEFAPDAYRLTYSSMVTPLTVFDCDPDSLALTPLKVQEIPSGYDPSKYATERLTVTARDGTKVPVSVVYPKGFPRDGIGKLFLYAYGAYGYAIPPASRPAGSACSIAAGPMRSRISAAATISAAMVSRRQARSALEHVQRFRRCREGADRGRLHQRGRDRDQRRSAGGELMGAVVNSDPDLWGAVVADVPFVDVLNTMLDAEPAADAGRMARMGQPDRPTRPRSS